MRLPGKHPDLPEAAILGITKVQVFALLIIDALTGYFILFSLRSFLPSSTFSSQAMAPALALHPRGVCQECAGQYPCAAWVGTPGMAPSTYGARQVRSLSSLR